MIYVTKALAAQIESCIKQSHIEVTKQYNQGQILELRGGAACFSGIEAYLSQVVGWGFETKSSQFKHDIQTIEAFYNAVKNPRVDIELCPFVGNLLAVFLSKRGYKVSELNNVSVMDLYTYPLHESLSDEFVIKEVSNDALATWAKTVALGFGYLEAQEQFFLYAHAKGIRAFGVFYLDEIIAGATVAVHGEVCDLGVTSTLPLYRGKGLQKKLIKARLNYAKSQGVHWAAVTTEPGSISDLNIQKTGFQCAYTRIKMTLGAF